MGQEPGDFDIDLDWYLLRLPVLLHEAAGPPRPARRRCAGLRILLCRGRRVIHPTVSYEPIFIMSASTKSKINFLGSAAHNYMTRPTDPLITFSGQIPYLIY